MQPAASPMPYPVMYNHRVARQLQESEGEPIYSPRLSGPPGQTPGANRRSGEIP